MQTWTYTSQTVDFDGEDIKLPTWLARQPLQPPSRSLLRRQGVFAHVQAEGMLFDTYADDGMKQIEFANVFTCGICFAFLQDPVLCAVGAQRCNFRACFHCMSKHHKRDGRCPACRREQAEPVISECVKPYLDEELRRHGICFRCNTDPPLSHSGALWCCRRSFDSLEEFKRHVSQQGTFLSTRLELKRHLRGIFTGDGNDPVPPGCMREKLRYVLSEDAVVLHAERRRRGAVQEGIQELEEYFKAGAEEASAMIERLRARSRSPRRTAVFVASDDDDSSSEYTD